MAVTIQHVSAENKTWNFYSSWDNDNCCEKIIQSKEEEKKQEEGGFLNRVVRDRHSEAMAF